MIEEAGVQSVIGAAMLDQIDRARGRIRPRKYDCRGRALSRLTGGINWRRADRHSECINLARPAYVYSMGMWSS